MSDVIDLPPLCHGCRTRHRKDAPCPDGTVWWTAVVECRVCTHRHVMVIPAMPDEPCPTDTECTRCGRMACDPAEGGQ